MSAILSKNEVLALINLQALHLIPTLAGICLMLCVQRFTSSGAGKMAARSINNSVALSISTPTMTGIHTGDDIKYRKQALGLTIIICLTIIGTVIIRVGYAYGLGQYVQYNIRQPNTIMNGWSGAPPVLDGISVIYDDIAPITVAVRVPTFSNGVSCWPDGIRNIYVYPVSLASTNAGMLLFSAGVTVEISSCNVVAAYRDITADDIVLAGVSATNYKNHESHLFTANYKVQIELVGLDNYAGNIGYSYMAGSNGVEYLWSERYKQDVGSKSKNTAQLLNDVKNYLDNNWVNDYDIKLNLWILTAVLSTGFICVLIICTIGYLKKGPLKYRMKMAMIASKEFEIMCVINTLDETICNISPKWYCPQIKWSLNQSSEPWHLEGLDSSQLSDIVERSGITKEKE